MLLWFDISFTNMRQNFFTFSAQYITHRICGNRYMYLFTPSVCCWYLKKRRSDYCSSNQNRGPALLKAITKLGMCDLISFPCKILYLSFLSKPAFTSNSSLVHCVHARVLHLLGRQAFAQPRICFKKINKF